MWRERISAITDEVEFSTPARELDILRAGEQISSPLPEDLKALLIESNGMVDQYGTDVIWPVERIIQDNEYFRSDQTFAQLYAPFHSLIFFGDNGGGDQIAFQADSGNSAVFVWDHETDERIPAADSLEDYVQKYFSSGGVDWFRE